MYFFYSFNGIFHLTFDKVHPFFFFFRSKNKNVVKLKDNQEYKWDDIWDALYYNFIHKHHTILKKIYATARNVYHWDNKSSEEQSDDMWNEPIIIMGNHFACG